MNKIYTIALASLSFFTISNATAQKSTVIESHNAKFELTPSGEIKAYSTKLYLGSFHVKASGMTYKVATGVFFNHVNIPAHAIVDSAFIQFNSTKAISFEYANGNSTMRSNYEIKMESDIAPKAFKADYFDVSRRELLNDSVDWSIASWGGENNIFEKNERTPNLSALIQQNVSQTTWTENNALSFVIYSNSPREELVNREACIPNNKEDGARIYLEVYYHVDASVAPTANPATGVENVNLEEPFMVFPNPVSGDVVNFNSVIDAVVLNAAGQVVLSVRNTKTINVSALTNGIYFLRRADGETIKLIVE